VILLIYGSPQYVIKLPGLPTGVVTLFGARLSAISLILTGVSFGLAALVAAGLRFTGAGRRIRAAGQDPILASQSGINVRAVYAVSWAIAAGLGGVAGIIYGSTNAVDSSMVDVALTAFPVILIGGLDSIEGAIVGAIVIGIFQGFVATYLGDQLIDVLTYSLLLVVMLILPQGLFGTRSVLRA